MLNPWLIHLQKHHSQNPHLTYRQAMSEAKHTYNPKDGGMLFRSAKIHPDSDSKWKAQMNLFKEQAANERRQKQRHDEAEHKYWDEQQTLHRYKKDMARNEIRLQGELNRAHNDVNNIRSDLTTHRTVDLANIPNSHIYDTETHESYPERSIGNGLKRRKQRISRQTCSK